VQIPNVDLSKTIIQKRNNNNNRYRWTRSDEFCVRSMLSGRFYRSVKARNAGDAHFIKYNYLGDRAGFLVNPLIGAENIKKVDALDNALSKKRHEHSVHHLMLRSEVAKKVWENENMVCVGDCRCSNNEVSTRNGVPVVKKRFCRRVPVGQEHLLEKSGVQIQNLT